MNVPPRAATTVDLVQPRDAVALGAALSPAETRTLAEYAVHGDMQRTADCMRRSVNTVRAVLHSVHRKTDTDSSVESMYRLGWINVAHAA